MRFKVLASVTIVNSAFQIALPVMLPHFLFTGERIPLCVSWHFLFHLLQDWISASRGKVSLLLFLLAFAKSFYDTLFRFFVVEWVALALPRVSLLFVLRWREHIINTFLYLLPVDSFLVVFTHERYRSKAVALPLPFVLSRNDCRVAEFAGVSFPCLYHKKNKTAFHIVVDNLPGGFAVFVINRCPDGVGFLNACVLHLRCICHKVYTLGAIQRPPLPFRVMPSLPFHKADQSVLRGKRCLVGG